MSPMRTPSTDSASDDGSDAVKVVAFKSKAKQEEMNNYWVSTTSLEDVVLSETEWVELGQRCRAKKEHRLQSIQGLVSPSQLTIPT